MHIMYKGFNGAFGEIYAEVLPAQIKKSWNCVESFLSKN